MQNEEKEKIKPKKKKRSAEKERERKRAQRAKYTPERWEMERTKLRNRMLALRQKRKETLSNQQNPFNLNCSPFASTPDSGLISSGATGHSTCPSQSHLPYPNSS